MSIFNREGAMSGIPAHSDVPVPQQSSAPKDNEALAELELKEIRRSEKPINKEGGRSQKIENILPWNDYTIVVLENSDKITIYDDKGEEVKDFSDSLNKTNVDIDIKKIVQDKRKTHLGNDSQVHSMVLNLKDLPPFLHKKGGDIIKRHSNDWCFPIANFHQKEHLLLSEPSAHILNGGKYIVFGNKGKNLFISYITENAAGVIQAPRNWKRIDPNSEVVPEDLQKYIETFEGLPGEYCDISHEKYGVLITDIGINIVDKNKINEKPLFFDNISGIKNNIVKDPKNPNTIFYCRNNNPSEVFKLDMSQDTSIWSPVSVLFPKKYESISNLQIDPTGNFFFFYSKEDLVVITKDTLEEVKRVPGLTQVNFDSTGRIRAINKDGFLVILEPNFADFEEELEKRRVAKIAEGVSIGDLFEAEALKKVAKTGESLEHLDPLRIKYKEQISEVISKMTTEEDALRVRQGFEKLKGVLVRQGLKQNEIDYIIEGLEEPIVSKEKEFALKVAQEALTSVRANLISGLTISSVGEARAMMTKVRAVEALLENNLREEVSELSTELEQKSLELFRQRGGEITKDIAGMIERTRVDIEAFTSKSQMDDWLEFRYPQLKSRLGSLLKDVPLEADEAYKAIISARNELQHIAATNEEKFKLEYAKVREKASERIGTTVDVLSQDADGLIDRLRTKGFTSRKDAEQYLSSSEAKKTLEIEIKGLSNDNPDVAKELEKGLKVRISNALTEIERGAMTKVAETGQQMILFGKTPFPKWEAKVKEKVERKVDVTFEEDERSHGPGVKATDIYGDISLSIKTSTGKVEHVRLYEGWEQENEWRLGLLSYRGESIPPSYLSAKEFKNIRKEYTDWSQGEKSPLRTEFEKKREALKETYSRRPKKSERIPELDVVWQNEYKEKLKEYSAFAAEHNISILRRIDEVKTEPEVGYTNGKGYVPEWQSHWVIDSQTEKDLEKMAEALKMQLDLQADLLNLKGHAGTGKDVRIKMFSSLTHRPYFGIDCSKWTTEFELSEDVMLESKDGASQTVKVPSAVLNGITTPGAIVYFNELNAMPEQAQIFLHSLMDEKRSLTLKTSSGKTIKALPSVILIGSMNPGYPGTFDPQLATRSRMVEMEIDYPPLKRNPDTGDNNPNLPYDASEALRLARGIDSLEDLTYEASLERNEFVKLWDRYVNGIENGAQDPTSTQKFDLDASLALVQFSNNLRADFIKVFEKTRESRNALPVTQPITSRELRRCAYSLSKMTPEEKATANPETVARNLLDKYFLTHIDKKEDQERIRTVMNTWTSKKRVRA
ncbi:AAA family ATPase [Patescibacteria group bacterium]|nr:AAA family ATPase [Patescibacteria group bacterium]